MQDEIFGPVLSIFVCATKEEAIAIENSNPYGNAAWYVPSVKVVCRARCTASCRSSSHETAFHPTLIHGVDVSLLSSLCQL